MKSQQIILAGIGMGSGDVITEEVRQLIQLKEQTELRMLLVLLKMLL